MRCAGKGHARETAWNENKEQVVRMRSTFRKGILGKMLYIGKFSKMIKT